MIDKVYLVECSVDYESTWIDSVYRNKEDAEKRIKELIKEKKKDIFLFDCIEVLEKRLS